MSVHEILKAAHKEYQQGTDAQEEVSFEADPGLEGMMIVDKSAVGWFCGKNFHSV